MQGYKNGDIAENLVHGAGKTRTSNLLARQRHPRDNSTAPTTTALLINNGAPTDFGLVEMQTDDTLFVGQPPFVTNEQKEIEIAGLRTRPVQTPTTTNALEVNGCTLTMVGNMDGETDT